MKQNKENNDFLEYLKSKQDDPHKDKPHGEDCMCEEVLKKQLLEYTKKVDKESMLKFIAKVMLGLQKHIFDFVCGLDREKTRGLYGGIALQAITYHRSVRLVLDQTKLFEEEHLDKLAATVTNKEYWIGLNVMLKRFGKKPLCAEKIIEAIYHTMEVFDND